MFNAPAPFGAILADPPWQVANRTGKVAPEHKRLSRYRTMSLAEIEAMPVADIGAVTAHLYLWVPNALLAEGLNVMKAWGFTCKTNLAPARWLRSMDARRVRGRLQSYKPVTSSVTGKALILLDYPPGYRVTAKSTTPTCVRAHAQARACGRECACNSVTL